jgi:hypothetical protein
MSPESKCINLFRNEGELTLPQTTGSTVKGVFCIAA